MDYIPKIRELLYKYGFGYVWFYKKMLAMKAYFSKVLDKG